MQAPSRRRKKRIIEKPNLVPILDANFIFIFFLLISASFSKIFEIPSDVPLVSTKEPVENKKPLALTVKVLDDSLQVFTGVPSNMIKSFGKTGEGEYDLQGLHDFLITIKMKHVKENNVILEPIFDVDYKSLIKIMDAMRVLKKTDPAIFVKDKTGLETKLEVLFDSIIFGNIQS